MDYLRHINYLNSIESISSAASHCGLDFTKVNNASAEIADLSGFLGITSAQAIFFSCMAELSFQKTVTLDNLAKHMKCGVLRLISSMGEFEALEKKGYILKTFRNRGRKHSYNDVGYTVPHYVIEAIRKADVSLLADSVRYDLPGFLKQVSALVDERSENDLPMDQVLSEVQFLIDANSGLPFVAHVNSELKDIVSKCTVFTFSYVRLKGQMNVYLEGFASALFDNISEQLNFTQSVLSGGHELITKNFLKIVKSEFDNDMTVCLTPQVTRMLYMDYPALMIKESEAEGMINHGSIPARKLYFEQSVMEQLRTIENALEPGMFASYREELQKNNLSRGITAIFFGSPGTGKTEAVYQLSRKTGRDIMMVDLSQTKSKWFGESEKQVKKIFEDYAALMKNSETEPILFINEADGLFTRRIDMNSSKGQAVDHSVNTMQNIMLQALENFEGILVATTNMTGNLDRAFERRFTFRVDFPKPDRAVRQRIWKSKLSELTDEEASVLGEKFELTGGEIDVQVKQVLLKKVLDRKTRVFDAVVECCSRDKGFNPRKKIGF